MKKMLLILSLWSCAINSVFAEVKNITNYSDFKKEIAGDAVVVKFYATWCSYCTLMVNAINNVANDLKGKVNFIKVDVNRANKEIMNEYKIKSYPTLIYFKKGQELTRTVGAQNERSLKYKIEQFLFNSNIKNNTPTGGCGCGKR